MYFFSQINRLLTYLLTYTSEEVVVERPLELIFVKVGVVKIVVGQTGIMEGVIKDLIELATDGVRLAETFVELIAVLIGVIEN